MTNLIEFLKHWSALFLSFPCMLFGEVELGLDRFLQEKRNGPPQNIALVINHTSFNRNMEFALDLFLASPDYAVKAIFTPEHGLLGSAHASEKIQDSKKEGIPVYSLFGQTRRPTKKMLENVDLIVYDIQSIGSRSYTYETTLFYIMEEAAKLDIPVVVLDRPNPMGGTTVDGLMLDSSLRSFIGYINIPYCHGMTIGELAHFFNKEYGICASLRVIPMKGWRRTMDFSETGLPWIPTSPNIPESDTPFYYSATGIVGELNFVSIGAAYTLPFKVIAAPWMDGARFAQKCNEQKLPGVYFLPCSFRPFFGLFKGKNVEGVLVRIRNKKTYKPLQVQYLLLGMLKSLYPKKFLKALRKHRHSTFIKALGSQKAYDILENEEYPFWKLMTLMQEEIKDFQKKRTQYLLNEYMH
ncbi:MAG: DUF1343 domain-containing protein [Chlamydiota bacterium]